MHESLLQPEVDANEDKDLLDALRRSRVYCEYERTFAEATGLTLALQPPEFFGLPFEGKRNENPFCAFLAGNKKWCALYLRTRARRLPRAGDAPRSFHCPFGLTETVVPIELGNRVIGFLCTGQVFTRVPKLAIFRKTFRELFGPKSSLENKALGLWQRTQFIPATKYEAMTQLLAFFARQTSTFGNQLVIERQNAELPVITRARKFIAQNKAETLSLSTVARAAGASVFHFCKLFHKTTGLKFTDYVARVRAEDARARLLNRNLRVSEIAYQVGFQSLTQFNRTFNRVFGQSPTEYRARLPAMATA